jgi:hypothetical protein
MTTITQFIRTTVVGGLFFLAPFVVLIVIIAKVFDFAKNSLNALLVHIPAASDLTAGAATVLAVALIALVCFLAGLLARSVPAKRMVDALESSVLSMIPGYDYLKQESASALGLTEIGELPVVFVPMEGGCQLGVQNRHAEQRPRLDLCSRRAKPSLRSGLFLFGRHRSPCRDQTDRRPQLPQAMRRKSIFARRYLAGCGIALLVRHAIWLCVAMMTTTATRGR